MAPSLAILAQEDLQLAQGRGSCIYPSSPGKTFTQPDSIDAPISPPMERTPFSPDSHGFKISPISMAICKTDV